MKVMPHGPKPQAINRPAKGKAGKVPNVPGATGAKPVPKPKPKKQIGLFNNHAILAELFVLFKMIKSCVG